MADSKKTSKAVVAKKKPNRLVRWWRETIGEIKKVTWPTKEDALRMTKIVVVVIVIMALFLGLIDLGFSELIGLIIS